MSFAWNLKTIRSEAGLTQEELAKKIGISQKTVSSWETGHTDRFRNAPKCTKLDIFRHNSVANDVANNQKKGDA